MALCACLCEWVELECYESSAARYNCESAASAPVFSCKENKNENSGEWGIGVVVNGGVDMVQEDSAKKSVQRRKEDKFPGSISTQARDLFFFACFFKSAIPFTPPLRTHTQLRQRESVRNEPHGQDKKDLRRVHHCRIKIQVPDMHPALVSQGFMLPQQRSRFALGGNDTYCCITVWRATNTLHQLAC